MWVEPHNIRCLIMGVLLPAEFAISDSQHAARKGIVRKCGHVLFDQRDRLLITLDGAIHRLDHTRKFSQYTVPSRVDETPAMILDKAIDDPAIRGQCTERRLFILPHETAVTVHVGA